MCAGDDVCVRQVMDVETQRLWALRVMGSLPLRCRCAFVVLPPLHPPSSPHYLFSLAER